MGDYYQMTISDWLASKTEEIRQELGKTAQSFVAIGYKLKEVRDSGNLAEGETIADYAQREFGLSASTTSRFIAINEKFGDGLELKSEYLKFGSGKLQEMLALTDADCELINHNHTVSQIREVKRFEAEKHEDVPSEPVQQHGAFEKCIIDYFKDKKKLLTEICEAEYLETDDYKRVADLISPNGSAIHKKGIVLMFMYQFDEGIKYKVFGEESAKQMSYIEFINTIRDIYSCEEGVNPHEAFYGVEQKEEKKVENTGNQSQQSESEKVQKETNKSQELATNSQEDANGFRDEAIGSREDNIASEGLGEDTTGTGSGAGRGDVPQGPESESEVFEESEKAASTMGEINEEVEDETDNGIARQNDHTDKAEADDEVEHVEVAAVEDFVDDSHEATPVETELAECLNLLDGWRKELCKPGLKSREVRELKDNMVPLIAQAMGRLAEALWDVEVEEEDDEEEE